VPKLLAAVLVATLALALGAAPASAHKRERHQPNYVYTATIDCGRGPVTVVSEEDLYAPLVDLERHRRYFPIAWDVTAGGMTIKDEKPGVPRVLKRFAKTCSYTDGVATGTVTVLTAPDFGRRSS
jgi:hypothetical protein